ncbi:MAG: hypothetical protein P4L80_18980 [Xanthobacteraceae bacterium]|nr:hypothetical protein [Xanthobacteraceae bacterium]
MGAKVAARPRHPDKDIEAAVAYAEEQGWTWFKVKGHAWGKLYCPYHDRDGCKTFVWSTPQNGGNHAKQIIRDVDRCPHKEEEKNDENV